MGSSYGETMKVYLCGIFSEEKPGTEWFTFTKTELGMIDCLCSMETKEDAITALLINNGIPKSTIGEVVQFDLSVESDALLNLMSCVEKDLQIPIPYHSIQIEELT
jgi:hypothetical protein